MGGPRLSAHSRQRHGWEPSASYVTDGWGIHDLRWTQALRSVGLQTQAYSLATVPPSLLQTTDADSPRETAPDYVVSSPAQVIARVGEADGVLAGPLPTVARPLVEAGLANIVGLSWGWDLQEGHPRARSDADLSWIPALRHLIVDSSVTWARARRLGMPETRMTLMPWGIDLAAFDSSGPIASLDVGSGTRVLLTLRAHESTYRTEDVIDAFAHARLDDAVLIIGSDGSLTPSLRSRVEDLGLADHVRFLGRIPEAQLAPLLRRADAYISASETDGTSVTLLQAMACGAPVIVSAIPGNLPWLDDGRAGQCFDVGDVQRLATLLGGIVRRGSTPDERVARAASIVRERADWIRNRRGLRALLAPTADPLDKDPGGVDQRHVDGDL